MPRARHGLRRTATSAFRRVAASALCIGAVGCVGGRGVEAPSPPTESVAYVESPLAEVDVAAERARFLAWRRSGRPHDAVARLDRLLDLFDAARFALDDDVRLRAREVLWGELGVPEDGPRGEAATHAAILRLYEVALSVEAQLGGDAEASAPSSSRSGVRTRRHRASDESQHTPTNEPPSRDGLGDARAFAADAVQLLATDTFTPRTSEELAVRTLVQRTLSESGHPRLADNARWRRHDHVVATLEAAVRAPARRRGAIGRVVEWDRADDPLAWQATHDDGQLPTAAELEAWITLADTHRDVLAADPRWHDLASGWADLDARLAARVRAFVPVQIEASVSLPRVAGLELAPVPAAPRLRVDAAGFVSIDGLPAAQDPVDAEPSVDPARDARDTMVAALTKAMLELGSEGVVLVMDAASPPASLNDALEIATMSGATRVELVLRDDSTGRPGVFVMPLVAETTTGPLRRALEDALASAHVTKHGVSLAIRVTPALPGKGDRRSADTLETGALASEAFAARWARYTAAYPRASVVPVVLDAELEVESLVALLRIVGARPPRATSPSAARTPPRAAPLLVLDRRGSTPDQGTRAASRPVEDVVLVDALLAARSERVATARASIEPSIPLPPSDTARLERVVEGLLACHAELVEPPRVNTRGGARRPVATATGPTASRVSVLLPFWDGRVDTSRPLDVVIAPAPPRAVRAAVVRCVESSLLGVALAAQRDPVEVTLTVANP